MAVPRRTPVPKPVSFVLAAALLLSHPAAAQLVAARINTNRIPAGADSAGVRVLALGVTRAIWHLDGDQAPGFEMLAFTDGARPPQVPGPMLRVRQGTRVVVRVSNPLPRDTLVVFGLADRARVATDSLVVPPGQAVTADFTADSAGTFLYWATTTHKTLFYRFGDDSELHGAFIVDPPGPVVPDRVFILSAHSDSVDADGRPEREFFGVNGRSWPHTERLTYAPGDTIRWRIINASGAPHPMHLHGAYFRVDGKGDWMRDTAYAGAAVHMSVTERLRSGQSMRIVWSPPHPGTWLFHCHLTWHILPHEPLVRTAAMADMPHADDPDHHVEQRMGGLMLATTVTAPAGYRVRDTERRHLRLFVVSDSTPADSARRFSYVLDQGGPLEKPVMRAPGPTIVLRRGEPTAIEVVNRSGEPTAVHWHGIELDSYFDGVVGLGGLPERLTPAIRDGASFVARMTPPRAGSFMYHTHLDDVRQQAGGLYGPLIVLEPGERWDPAHDLVQMLGTAPDEGTVLLDGSTDPPPLELRRGETYRLRLFNITLDQPNTSFELLDGDRPLEWLVLATDGWSWSAGQRATGPARRVVSIGQTADVRFTPTTRGEFTLVARNVVKNIPIRSRKVIVR